MIFEFATAGRIIFGPGTLENVVSATGELLHGRKRRPVLVVGGRSGDRAARVVELLREVAPAEVFSVDGEPTVQMARDGAHLARQRGCGLVIGIGGGSAIDAAKAVAALATNDGDVLDYLEVIGRGQPLRQVPLPCIAIPTTAGTGSEVTRNAVLASPEHQVKVSLRHPRMLPRVAIIDPELTYGLSSAITASTGLDALTQLIEPYVSIRANPLTDGLCSEGFGRVVGCLPLAYERGDHAWARQEMCIASLLGGMALANAGLGAVHGFAGPIGGMFPAPHGAVCAALLPHVTEVNIRALRERMPDSEALHRYGVIAIHFEEESDARPENAVAGLTRLGEQLQIPRLRAYGVTTADIPTLVEKAQAASSMKGNPIVLTPDELAEILERAI